MTPVWRIFSLIFFGRTVMSEFEFEKDGWRYIMRPDGRLYLVRPDGKHFKVGVFREGVFFKEENGRGFHYQTQSFGFPYHMIAVLYKKCGLQEIVVRYRGEEYRLRMDDIVEDGKLRRDLVRVEEYPDTEKRIFIPLRLFNVDMQSRVKLRQRSLF